MTAEAPTILNRKANHLYHVEESFELGVMLHGSEVKSIRAGKISLNEAWVDLSDKMELWLVGAHIDEYRQASIFNHLPAQRRKLLAHQHEILKMKKAKELKGYTLIPLKLYFKGRLVKVSVGICKGKDVRDRRQDLMKQESRREVERIVKRQRQ
ncbi:MAG TPA: SsrA-binding protein SmpB [Fibrobacteraceae bacterium]|nr:SsrA-binding protein SmpB [Fibrobacteraceae bacterium]